MRKLAFLIAVSCLSSIALARSAAAVPAYIDRTRRTIEVPAECLATPGWLDNLGYDNGAGVTLAHVGGRFTLVLSVTQRLQARVLAPTDFAYYHFIPGDANYDTGLSPQQRLARAYTMMRCGLPVTPGDRRLFAMPTDAAAARAFIRFAMGDGGTENRTATGYTLLGNGEREALLMYAAERIKFDLTPTVFTRGRICILYSRISDKPDCAREIPANLGDRIVGYLYEGMNRVSYTGHEFWMMFSIEAYRSKVFFTSDEQTIMGRRVDTFVTWDATNNTPVLWTDPGGNPAVYPTVPYRFQGWADPANHHGDFYQRVLDQYLRTHHPQIVTYGQF